MKPFDVQVNGYAGADFCSEQLTTDDLLRACEALAADGVDGILATVITDTVDALVNKLRHLVRLRSEHPLAERMIAGFHIEGPFLNPSAGFIGAHPADAVIPANVEDTKRLLDAAGGLTRMVTIAPECDPGFACTQYLADQGITVAAGHCDPDLQILRTAIDCGVSMVTHFGNGCPVNLPRHDNILQRFLACRRHLWFGLIPDGIHVSLFALRNYLDLIGVERAVMTTDAIAAARLGAGTYELSGFTVEVDESGTARRPGSPNLAGSTVTMPRIREILSSQLQLTDEEIVQVLDRNPRRACQL